MECTPNNYVSVSIVGGRLRPAATGFTLILSLCESGSYLLPKHRTNRFLIRNPPYCLSQQAIEAKLTNFLTAARILS